MSKSKHKLSGYAIKGDGTQETAERIRKVFEADGWDCVSWSFMEVSGNSAYYGDVIDHKIYYYYSDKPLIPLTEAERIVFGDELKVGMKVVFTDEAKKELDHLPFRNDIHEISVLVTRNWGLPPGKYAPILNHDIDVKRLRRATITDFLRTLPSDIAERALRQVDEGYLKSLYPESLKESIGHLISKGTDEGYHYWKHVSRNEYDRARAILAEKDRVGKWWKTDLGVTFRCTQNKNGYLYGYGVDNSGNWFDRTKTDPLAFVIGEKGHLTLATPEEVEAVLDAERVKRGLIEGVVVKSAVGSDNKPIGAGSLYLYDHTEMYDKDGRTCIMKKGKWAEIITPAPEKGEPQPTDKFPRVMWVVASIGESEYLVRVKDNPDKHDGLRGDGYFVYGGDKFYELTGSFNSLVRIARPEEVQEHFDRMDTHPVTGEPAVKKDVVEQIREVVDSRKGSVSERMEKIKEILTKNEK